MPPTSITFRMADRLTDGKLATLILERRAADASFGEIARFLATEYGVEVTDQTVNNWHETLETEAKDAVA